MPVVSVADVRKQLAARAPAAIYVLTGPDDREKSALANEIADLVEPELRAFNVERFYGADASPLDVSEAARTLPMMGDRRIVVVMQAERMLNPKRKPMEGEEMPEEESEGGGDTQPLVDYVARPNETTVVVFVLSPADASPPGRGHDLLPLNGSTKITKALAKHASVVSVGGFGSEREVLQWLDQRAREAGLGVERAAAQALVEAAAGDAAKFRADVERVVIFARGEGAITAAHVEAAIVAHETSTDDWAIARAIESGDAATALREARVRLEEGDSPFQMLGQLAYVIRTPPPRGRYPAAKLEHAVDALFRTDIALKSSGGDPRALIERLIVELCG